MNAISGQRNTTRNIATLARIVMFCVLAVGNVAASPAAAEHRSCRLESAIPSSTSDIGAFACLPYPTVNRQALALGSARCASSVGEQ